MINDEARRANVSRYLRPEHFTNGPLSLYLVTFCQEEKQSTKTGKNYTQNVYGFLDQNREERIFNSFLDDAFWHAFDKADPEKGQLLKISAEEVAQNTYIWTIEPQKDILTDFVGEQDEAEANGGLTPEQAAGKQVLEDGKDKQAEEEIRIEDIPF